MPNASQPQRSQLLVHQLLAAKLLLPLQAGRAPACAWRAREPELGSQQQGRACARTGGACNPPLLLLHHACSRIPAAAGVLSSQVPAPNLLHKEKTARTIAPFFPFFFCTQIYTGYYTHLYTDSATQNTQLSTGRAPTATEAVWATAVPTETGASQPACWTRARVESGRNDREAGSTPSPAQPRSSGLRRSVHF